MTISTAVALVLALPSTTITNPAYLREHDAAAALPVLSMRRPVNVPEPVPSGAFGGLRVLALAAVTAGAFLLARPDTRAANAER